MWWIVTIKGTDYDGFSKTYNFASWGESEIDAVGKIEVNKQLTEIGINVGQGYNTLDELMTSYGDRLWVQL